MYLADPHCIRAELSHLPSPGLSSLCTPKRPSAMQRPADHKVPMGTEDERKPLPFTAWPLRSSYATPRHRRRTFR
jgi:hypothetical protein